MLDPQRHRGSRHLPAERRDVPCLRRLLPSGHPARGAQPLAGHLYLHARQRRRRRRRSDPRAGRDHSRASRDPESGRHPASRSRRDGGGIRSRAGAHGRADPPRAHATGRSALEGHPRQGAPRGRHEGRLRRKEGDGSAQSHLAVGRERATARTEGRRRARPGHACRQHPMLCAVRPPTTGVPKRSFAPLVPASDRHRGHGIVDLGAIRRPRRNDGRNRSFRALSARIGGHEGAWNDRRARRPGREAIALKRERARRPLGTRPTARVKRPDTPRPGPDHSRRSIRRECAIFMTRGPATC